MAPWATSERGEFDIEDQRRYSDKYFLRAASILQADGLDSSVVMQVFCRSDATLCGVTEAVELIRQSADNLVVRGLSDGDAISPWETVLLIKGSYRAFAHLETLLLGVLARGTRVATQAREIVAAAAGKPVLFFGGRHDHYRTQEADGHAALVGGAAGVATDAQGERAGVAGIGTVPHALIAAYGGDTVLGSCKFVEFIDEAIPFIALVDFDNDCVGTSLKVADALGDRLRGVRLDTSASLTDVSLRNESNPEPGVSPMLVRKVRQALDEHGHRHVEIVLSGGLTSTKVARYITEEAPVDAFGVGSSILRNEGAYDFTADIVSVDGRAVSKVGRSFKSNDRLKTLG